MTGTGGGVTHTTQFILSVGVGVGGDIALHDKLGLLAPFIGLASLILAATTVTALYVRRARNREEEH